MIKYMANRTQSACSIAAWKIQPYFSAEL